MKYTNEIELKEQMKKLGHLSSYHVYSQSYGHQNAKNDSVFVFSADDTYKIFKCLMHLRIQFSSFRKYYELLGSELPLAAANPQDFGIFSCNSVYTQKKIISTFNFIRIKVVSFKKHLAYQVYDSQETKFSLSLNVLYRR